ncbi:glycine cleavage system protein R [Conexibacter sp. SYSU D00693]|uniref:glycine cleavage system protein R n=1 Tax=Conexibacter sp. SYSU D00693 TaxID=2812560 RepID=UPI00196A4AEB|nr:ACT domain-containing protein [Conexibacter sp. SYSU D00693]
MRPLAVTAIGRDRPGIVAALTGVLVAHRVNLADSQMGLLGGRFSMLLVVEPPPEADLALLQEDLGRIADDLGLDVVAVHEVGEGAEDPADPTHLLTVYGVDHPGIVHAVTTELSRRDVSITDLSTRRVEDGDEDPLYAMMLEVATPPSMSDDDVAAALERVAREQDLDVVVRRLGVEDDA